MEFNKKAKALIVLANLGEENLNYNQVKEVLKEALIIQCVVKSFDCGDNRLLGVARCKQQCDECKEVYE